MLNSYPFGFNGQERETEINQSVTSAEYWFYDGRLGRRWNIDPVVKPWESSYATFANNPIFYNDPNGDNPPGYENSVAPTQNTVNAFFDDTKVKTIIRVAKANDIEEMLIMRIIYRENTTKMANTMLGKAYGFAMDRRENLGDLKYAASDLSKKDMQSTGLVQMQLRHAIRLTLGLSEEGYNTWKSYLLSDEEGQNVFKTYLEMAENLLSDESSAIDLLGKFIKELKELNPNSTDDDIHKDYMRGVKINRDSKSKKSDLADAAIVRTNKAIPLLKNRLKQFRENQQKKIDAEKAKAPTAPIYIGGGKGIDPN